MTIAVAALAGAGTSTTAEVLGGRLGARVGGRLGVIAAAALAFLDG